MKRYLLFVDRPYSFGILRPLQDAIHDRGDVVKWYVVKPKDRVRLQDGDDSLESVQAVKEYDPRAVFAPGNFIPDFFPGVKVMVFHGLGPIKRGHYRIRGFFDLYCVPGPGERDKFMELARRHGNFSVADTGWIKLDSLLRNVPEPPADRERPLLLYAPTFSPSMTSAPHLVEPIRMLTETRNWDWVAKFHDKMDPRRVEEFGGLGGSRFRIETGPDINPLLHAADVILTDTSSVVNEGLFLGKPVVTFRNLNPGDHIIDVREAGDLAAALERALAGDPAVRERAEAFVDRIHPHRDGRSSERVLDATEDFIKDVRNQLKPRPLNLLRKIKIRRRMGYYRPT